jgi:hypothetical protein
MREPAQPASRSVKAQRREESDTGVNPIPNRLVEPTLMFASSHSANKKAVISIKSLPKKSVHLVG